jgi:hypothetical protein
MIMRTRALSLALCLVCIVGLACSSSSNAGAFCGGFAGIQCAADEYCDYTNNECGVADGAGTCRSRPEVCPDISSPTCACNGRIYSSECVAAAAGFDLDEHGNCPPPPGSFNCSHSFCDLATEYCQIEIHSSGPDAFRCVSLPSACSSASCGCLSAEPCGKSCTGDSTLGLTVTCP